MRRLFDNKLTRYLKYVWEELQNQKENRELIGVDRDGNKYWQYYSYYGLPTRREIRFKVKGNYDITDLVYYNWLYKIQIDPPTQEEKIQFYLQEKLRYHRALEWDKKQRQNIQQFKKKRQEILSKHANPAQLEEIINPKIQLTSLQTKRKTNTQKLDQAQQSQVKQLFKRDQQQHKQQRKEQAYYAQQQRLRKFAEQFTKNNHKKTKNVQ